MIFGRVKLVHKKFNKNVFFMFLISFFLILSFYSTGLSAGTGLVLHKGWNMVSSPANAPLSISVIQSSCKMDPRTPVWHYNSVQKWQASDKAMNGLSKIDSLELDKGYWVWVNEACSVTQSYGTRYSAALLTIKEGWNMISSPINTAVPISEITTKCAVSGPVWYYDGSLPDTSKTKWRHSQGEYFGNVKIDSIAAP